MKHLFIAGPFSSKLHVELPLILDSYYCHGLPSAHKSFLGGYHSASLSGFLLSVKSESSMLLKVHATNCSDT